MRENFAGARGVPIWSIGFLLEDVSKYRILFQILSDGILSVARVEI